LKALWLTRGLVLHERILSEIRYFVKYIIALI
jgi:hypothetical protein